MDQEVQDNIVDLKKDKKLKNVENPDKLKIENTPHKYAIDAHQDILILNLKKIGETLPPNSSIDNEVDFSIGKKTIVFLKGKTLPIQKQRSKSIYQPNVGVDAERVCMVYIIEFLKIDRIISNIEDRNKWLFEMYNDSIIKKRKAFWDSMGAKYIVDYDIKRIFSGVREESE